jgi:hypothetical protein
MTNATTRWGANVPTVHNPNGCTQLGKAVDYCWVCDCEHFARVPLNTFKVVAKGRREKGDRLRSARGREEDKAWDDFRSEFYGTHWGEEQQRKEEQILAAYENRYAFDKHHADVGSNEDEAWALRYNYEETP